MNNEAEPQSWTDEQRALYDLHRLQQQGDNAAARGTLREYVRAAVERRDREWKAAVHVGATPETAAAKIQEQQDAAVEQAVERAAQRAESYFDRHPDNAPCDLSCAECGDAIAAAIREGKT